MKAVLMSIQPKWCELIASGKKTIEVRKTRPKLEMPFKVYIYESSGNTRVGNQNFNVFLKGKGRKKVIGEFICECITSLKADNIVQSYYNNTQATCLTDAEIMCYAYGGKLYYWHISNLVIYDNPKELNEFTKPYGTILKAFESRFIQRPPLSWCYVEELKEME